MRSTRASCSYVLRNYNDGVHSEASGHMMPGAGALPRAPVSHTNFFTGVSKPAREMVPGSSRRGLIDANEGKMDPPPPQNVVIRLKS